MSNNFKVFASKKIRGYKQDSQSRLKLPMPEVGEP